MKVASRLLGIENPHILAITRIEQDLFTSIPKPIASVTTLTLPLRPLQDYGIERHGFQLNGCCGKFTC
jgi:hypothetical protein